MFAYVEFRPIVVAGDEYLLEPAPTEPGDIDRYRHVFEYYSVDYRISNDGRLLVPESLARDLDTMWNYTTKARDPEWRASHSPQGAGNQ